MKNKYLGAHLPIGKGFVDLFYQADELGINCIQCFTASNQMWVYKNEIDEKKVKNYFEELKKRKNYFIVSHAGYLLNLASDNSEIIKKTERALAAELERSNFLEFYGVVIHPGSAKDRKNGIKRVSEVVKKVRNSIKTKTKILLENSAGMGNSLPSDLEELAEMFELCYKNDHEIEIVVDTCHCHASGYDFSDEEKQGEYWNKFDKLIGINKVAFIHINDSKKKCGERIDRHENIGNGTIGKNGFKYLMQNEKLKKISKILETPFYEISDYKKEIDFLRSF